MQSSFYTKQKEVKILQNFRKEMYKFECRDSSSLILKWFKEKGVKNPLTLKDALKEDTTLICDTPMAGFSGCGLLIYPKTNGKESCYLGEFLGGSRHGKGYRLQDGTIYIGEYQYESKNGKGASIKADTGEIFFKGNFAFDQMHGECYFKNSDYEYFGEINNGIFNGKTEIKYANNDRFEGTIFNGLINGKGTLNFANGDCYDGQFKNNVMHGTGTYKWANGKIFRGEFFEGRMQYTTSQVTSMQKIGEIS